MPWSIENLQTCLTVLREIDAKKNKTTENIISEITEIIEKLVESRKFAKVGAAATAQKIKKCPSCGKAMMSPVINSDGLEISGCAACRYSEVVS